MRLCVRYGLSASLSFKWASAGLVNDLQIKFCSHTLHTHQCHSCSVSSRNLWSVRVESQMLAGSKEEKGEVVVLKSESGPTHDEAFLGRRK